MFFECVFIIDSKRVAISYTNISTHNSLKVEGNKQNILNEGGVKLGGDVGMHFRAGGGQRNFLILI